MPEPTNIEKLQKVMEELPDSTDISGPERREYSLTKGDVLLIYKIATIANAPCQCPFDKEEQSLLQGMAKNMNKTQKIASSVLIYGVATAVLSAIWFAVVHAFKEWVKV